MLACLSPTSPLLMRGALRFVEAPGPAADRPVAVAARLAGFLLDAPLPAPALCRVEIAGADPGRADEVARRPRGREGRDGGDWGGVSRKWRLT